MTDAVASAGVANTAPPVRAVAAATPVASPSRESAPLKTLERVQPISPVIKSDAISGTLITQYFTGSGQVDTQIPSVAALAYLRQGLTSTGLPKESQEATVA